MTLILLAVLAQTGAQEATIEDRIAAFINGDAAARGDLLKLGAAAIRPLREARDRDPERIGNLVFEIKKAAAWPDATVAEILRKKVRVVIPLDAIADNVPLAMEKAEVAAYFVDVVDAGFLKSMSFSLDHPLPVPLRTIADDICSQTGLDYGFFHNLIVFAHPDRLWPRPAGPALTDAETARAKQFIHQLGAESIEERDAAARALHGMGPRVVPLLKADPRKDDPEFARRRDLLVQLLGFHLKEHRAPAAAKRIAVDPEGIFIHRCLTTVRASLKFGRATLGEVLAELRDYAGLKIEVPAELNQLQVSVVVDGALMMDALAVITQFRGLDFTTRDSTIVIGYPDRLGR